MADRRLSGAICHCPYLLTPLRSWSGFAGSQRVESRINIERQKAREEHYLWFSLVIVIRGAKTRDPSKTTKKPEYS